MRFAWGVLAAFVLRRFTAVTFGSIGWPLRVFGIIGLSIAIRVTWLARLRATVLALLLIPGPRFRSEEHTSELQSLMRISYAVFCLKKKNIINHDIHPPLSTLHDYSTVLHT